MRRVPRDECWYFGSSRPRKPMELPRRYTLKNGTVVEMNNLQSEDVDAYCHLFVEATERGEGEFVSGFILYTCVCMFD